MVVHVDSGSISTGSLVRENFKLSEDSGKLMIAATIVSLKRVEKFLLKLPCHYAEELESFDGTPLGSPHSRLRLLQTS